MIKHIAEKIADWSFQDVTYDHEEYSVILYGVLLCAPIKCEQ